MKTAGEPSCPSEVNLKVMDQNDGGDDFPAQSAVYGSMGFLVKVPVKHRRAVRAADIVDLSYASLALSKLLW